MKIQNKPPRITMQYIFKYVLQIVNLERGLFFTIKELAFRPGKAIQKFLSTQERKQFMKPVSFLLLMVSIGTFLSLKLVTNIEGLGLDEIIAQAGKVSENDSFLKKILANSNEYILKYFHLFQLIKVPFIALFTFLFFKKVNFNYAEHLVANSYIIGFISVIFLVLAPVLFISFKSMYLLTFLTFFYTFYAYIKTFNEKILMGILKSLLVLLFSNLLHLLFIVIFAYFTVPINN